jgi:hypothetical protein
MDNELLSVREFKCDTSSQDAYLPENLESSFIGLSKTNRTAYLFLSQNVTCFTYKAFQPISSPPQANIHNIQRELHLDTLLPRQ